MRVDELVKAAGGLLRRGDGLTEVRSVAYDSRSVADGALFVALRGGYTDGHRFLDEALRSGAVAALVERGTPDERLIGYPAVIEVSDTRASLAPVAAAFFGHPSSSMTVIGITGTDGKTTTSYFIDAICREAGIPTGMIGTVEVRIGDEVDRHASRQTTPESLQIQHILARMRDSGLKLAVVEATSHGLAMHRLDHCDMDVGVVTNITHEHLDFHGTVEAYRAAKGRLLEFVAASVSRGKLGKVVLNYDDPGAGSIKSLAGTCDVIWFSRSGSCSAEVRGGDARLEADGSEFDLQIGSQHRTTRIYLPGGHNIENALAAAATGHALGISIDTIERGLASLRCVPGRMERIDVGQGFTVLVDYAHSPEAIRGILSEARRISQGRVLVLFGSAGERDVEKRAIQGSLAVELADFAVFTSEDPRFEDPDTIIMDIAHGASKAGGKRGVDFECIEDRGQAIARILERARAGDVVVLAGKGHERSMIYQDQFRPWNEADIARAALRSLGYTARPERESR
jgi:UDP-N-acetylmuramoyl-L-alanyl-D-glutamate--2,6-diaminopimelate ligase